MTDRFPGGRSPSRHEPEVSRPLLLAGLSVLGFWSLLVVLAGGLYQVVNALESVRAHLEKITMGVRAIEQETKPLSTGLDQLAASLSAEGVALGAATSRLADVARDVRGLSAEC